MVICLEWGADLHLAQLMPMPLTVSCFSKIQIGSTFLVLAHLGSPGKRAIKWVCVCTNNQKKTVTLLKFHCYAQHKMQPIVTNVLHKRINRSIEVPFGVRTRVSHILGGGPNLHRGRGNFGGISQPTGSTENIQCAPKLSAGRQQQCSFSQQLVTCRCCGHFPGWMRVVNRKVGVRSSQNGFNPSWKRCIRGICSWKPASIEQQIRGTCNHSRVTC